MDIIIKTIVKANQYVSHVNQDKLFVLISNYDDENFVLISQEIQDKDEGRFIDQPKIVNTSQ